MKILYTGFKGKNNASCQLIELIDPSDKILLTNSFEGIKRDLDNISLELYDLIIMFGINKKLKGKIVEVISDGETFGRTYKDAPDIDGTVQFTEPVETGKIFKAKIIAAQGYRRIAKPVK